MASVSVQLGLLAIAKDWANADLRDVELASARATAAGHRVMVQQVVGDTEAAIRETLTRWIDDPTIDVIIVLGGAESDAVSVALKPLIGNLLPGFTDLFRFLSFQEDGASAMLSTAEAARCKDTFVFVLPGAVGAAMDKLILPQLDPATLPKNLVTQMPRLRAEAEADKSGPVPVAIIPEKTRGGSGVAARLPAEVTARARKHSTGAHVIVRNKPDLDPVTAPIDLERLEREIAASGRGEGRLPRVPPGADDPGEDDVTRADVLAVPSSPHEDTNVGVAPAPERVTIKPRNRTEGGSKPPRTHPPTSPPRAKAPETLDEPPVVKLKPRTTGSIPLEDADMETLDADLVETGAVPKVDLTPLPTKKTTPPPVRPTTPPPIAKRAPTEPPPIAKRAPTEPPPIAKRTPTEPPPVAKRPAVTAPSGMFTDPTKRTGLHPAVKIAGLLAVTALGFFAFVFVFRDKPPVTVPVDASVAMISVDAASVTPIELPDADVPAITPDAAEIEMVPTKPTGTKPTGTRPTGTKPIKPDVQEPGSGSAAPVEPPPPPVEDGCDETACVLGNYDKPCCAKFKPVKADLSKREGGLPESLDKSMVRAGVEGVKARVVTCGEKAGVQGKVTVALKVSSDGAVTSATLADSPDAALGACVVGAMKSAKFGKTVNGGEFSYPFVF